MLKSFQVIRSDFRGAARSLGATTPATVTSKSGRFRDYRAFSAHPAFLPVARCQPCSPRRPGHVATTEYVHVDVMDGLASVGAGVDDGAVARLRDALCLRDLGGDHQEASKRGRIIGVGERGDVRLGDDEYVRGRLGSRNARVWSSSRTIFAGISRRTMRQNRQSLDMVTIDASG